MNYSIKKLEKAYEHDASDTLRTLRLVNGTEAIHILTIYAQLEKAEPDAFLTLNEVTENTIHNVFEQLMLSGYEFIRNRTRNNQEAIDFNTHMVRITGVMNETDIKSVTYQELKHVLDVLIATDLGKTLCTRFEDDLRDMDYPNPTQSDVINQMHYALLNLYDILNDVPEEDTDAFTEVQHTIQTHIVRPITFANELLSEMCDRVAIGTTTSHRTLKPRTKERLNVFFNKATTADVVYFMQCLAQEYVKNYLNDDTPSPYTSSDDTQMNLRKLHETNLYHMRKNFLYYDGIMEHLAPILDELNDPRMRELNWSHIIRAYYDAFFFTERAFSAENQTWQEKSLRYNTSLHLVPLAKSKLDVSNLEPGAVVLNESFKHAQVTSLANNVVSLITANVDDDNMLDVTVQFYEKKDSDRVEVTTESSTEFDPYYMSEDARYTLIPLICPDNWVDQFKTSTHA